MASGLNEIFGRLKKNDDDFISGSDVGTDLPQR